MAAVITPSKKRGKRNQNPRGRRGGAGGTSLGGFKGATERLLCSAVRECFLRGAAEFDARRSGCGLGLSVGSPVGGAHRRFVARFFAPHARRQLRAFSHRDISGVD